MAVRATSERFGGKVAFVTGAARGQGRNHAVAMAREGADIIAVDICEQIDTSEIELATEADLAETARLVEAEGRRVVARKVDVRDGDALRTIVDEGVAELGRLDVVCANAGIVEFGQTVEFEEQRWDDVVGVNLKGVWNTCRVAVPHIRAHGDGGSLILTSSVCGLIGIPNLGAYNSAKHGVVGLMRTLAIELGPDRIRVNSVHPATVETPMTDNTVHFKLYFGEDTQPTREEAVAPGSPLHAVNALPIPWMHVDDITNAVLFLASDEGRYITGITMPIDAGYVVGGHW